MRIFSESKFAGILIFGFLNLCLTASSFAGSVTDGQTPGISIPLPDHLNPTYQRSVSVNRDTGSNGGSFIFRQLYDDVTYLIKEPDFYGIVGGISLTPTLFSQAFRRESPEITELWAPSLFADNFFEVGESIGNGAFPVIASAASWGVGKISGSNRLSKFGSDLFRAQVINGFFTTVMKGAINRTRPNGGAYSYPSGHTSSAFAMAGTIYADFGKTWGIPAFVLAGYVGLSRLQEGKHYISDVIAGGILGTYISFKLGRRNSSKNRVTISPLVNDSVIGLKWGFKF